MSATFNGSSAYLLTANNIVGGSTPTYPVLLGGWVKLANVTAAMTSFCIGDGASAAYDLMELQCRGDQPSDPVMAQSAAGGGGTALSQANGLTAGAWLFVGAYFIANNSRYAILGSTLGTHNVQSKASTGLSLACLGARYWDSAANSFHNGSMAEMFAASGFSTGNITTILTQLAAGSKPIHVAELAASLTMYQPLSAGLNEAGYVGPTWTPANMAYNAGDHPVMLSNPWLLLDMPMQDDAASATVVDESEYGNDGTLSSGTTAGVSVAGPGGSDNLDKAFLFDTTGINLDEVISLDASVNELTLSFFFKLNYNGSASLLGNSGGTTATYVAVTQVLDGFFVVEVQDENESIGTFNTAGLELLTWYHCAIRFPGDGSAALFINAVEIAEDFTSGDPIENLYVDEVCFSSWVGGNHEWATFCGLRIYSRALSLAEIQAEAARGGDSTLTQNTRNLLFGGN